MRFKTLSNLYIYLGQQEYSSRSAAITWGIILAVLIPLLLLIAYAALVVYRRIVKRNEENENEYSGIQKVRSLQRLSRPHSVEYEEEEDDDYELPQSPVSSDERKSDTGIGSMKKRRSYDKVYRTNEPLQGRPNGEFEEKKWDPNEDIYEEVDGRAVSPIDSARGSSQISPTSPLSPTSSILYSIPYNSQPDLLKMQNNIRFTENDDIYALPMKKNKQRFSSQSSIITDV